MFYNTNFISEISTLISIVKNSIFFVNIHPLVCRGNLQLQKASRVQGRWHTDAAAAADNSASLTLTAATLEKCESQQQTHTHTRTHTLSFLPHRGHIQHPAATLPFEYSKRGKVDLRSESNNVKEGGDRRGLGGGGGGLGGCKSLCETPSWWSETELSTVTVAARPILLTSRSRACYNWPLSLETDCIVRVFPTLFPTTM